MEDYKPCICGRHKAIDAQTVIKTIDRAQVHVLAGPLHLIDRVQSCVDDEFVQVCLANGCLRFDQPIDLELKKRKIVPANYHKHF